MSLHSHMPLLVLTSATFAAAIVMALCLPLVIPKYLVNPHYAKKDANRVKMRETCLSKCSEDYDEPCMATPFIKEVKTIGQNVYNRERHEYLVSIIEEAYRDTNMKRFLCTGTALSRSWIITGASCFNSVLDTRKVQVRLGSSKWNEGGELYDVTKKSKPFQNMIAIHISKQLPIRPIKLLFPFYVLSQEDVETIGWEDEYPVAEHADVNSLTWSYKEHETHTQEAHVSEELCTGKPSGRPVLFYNTLISVEVCKKFGESTFADLDNKEFHDWWLKLNERPLMTKYEKTSFDERPKTYYQIPIGIKEQRVTKEVHKKTTIPITAENSTIDTDVEILSDVATVESDISDVSEMDLPARQEMEKTTRTKLDLFDILRRFTLREAFSPKPKLHAKAKFDVMRFDDFAPPLVDSRKSPSEDIGLRSNNKLLDAEPNSKTKFSKKPSHDILPSKYEPDFQPTLILDSGVTRFLPGLEANSFFYKSRLKDTTAAARLLTGLSPLRNASKINYLDVFSKYGYRTYVDNRTSTKKIRDFVVLEKYENTFLENETELLSVAETSTTQTSKMTTEKKMITTIKQHRKNVKHVPIKTTAKALQPVKTSTANAWDENFGEPPTTTKVLKQLHMPRFIFVASTVRTKNFKTRDEDIDIF